MDSLLYSPRNQDRILRIIIPEEKCYSVVSNSLETPWTAAHQALLSMEHSGQEYWSGWPFPSSWDLPHPGIKPGSPSLQADSILSEPPGKSNHP